MPYQNISTALVKADADAVKAAIATINTKLPFLIALTIEEKRAMVKLGPKSVDFVRDANWVAQNYGQILPTNFNKAELAKDSDLFQQLSEIQLLLNTLCEKVNDTTVAVGNEAMRSSLQVYDYVKAAAKTEPGLKSVADQLNQRFKGQGRKGKPKPE